MKKSRNVIIWTEDFHDNLFLICLELITETYNDILAVVPRRKFNRLSQVIKNNSKNVQFFILNSPYLFHDTSKHSYIKKILNRMRVLVTKIDNYFMLQAKELEDLIENYEMADLLVFEAAGLNFKLLEIIKRYDFIQQRIFINHNPDFNGGIYSFFDKFYYLNPNTDLSRSPNTKEQYFLDTMISNKEIIASRKKILKKLNTSKN